MVVLFYFIGLGICIRVCLSIFFILDIGMIFSEFFIEFGMLVRFLVLFFGIIISLMLLCRVVSSFFFRFLIGSIWLCNVILLVMVILWCIGILVMVEIIVVVIVIFVDGLFLGVVFFGMWMWIFFLLKVGGLMLKFIVCEWI